MYAPEPVAADVSLRVNRNVLHMLAPQILMVDVTTGSMLMTSISPAATFALAARNIHKHRDPGTTSSLAVFQQIGAPQHNGFAVLQYQRQEVCCSYTSIEPTTRGRITWQHR